MFQHILVPIDLSARNERTLHIALGIARIQQSLVTLLHLIQGIAGGPSCMVAPNEALAAARGSAPTSHALP
jgi:hypothetical protein